MSDPIVVIPARLRSTRLPGKVLADIDGKPMLRHVFERVKKAVVPSDVLIATDSKEVADQANSWGAKTLMTSSDCTCGTQRIASIVDQLDSDIIVNVQGDEPLIDPMLVDELCKNAIQSTADMVTPILKITDTEVLLSPTTVKVVIREDGSALYFSRSPVPCLRDEPLEKWVTAHEFWLQVGTYAFRKNALLEYLTWVESPLEKVEKIEQLRFLEAGKRIQTFETHIQTMAVDTQHDLDIVRGIIRSQR